MLTSDHLPSTLAGCPPSPATRSEERQRAIGRRVQHERMRADLTRLDLVDRAGVDRITLQRIEAGTTDARLSWLLRIAGALAIPLADLVRE
ncbi:helix-turn-helix domain-containing protein [Streptomyces qinglanensis]|uniref:helix-turn-helix domain-containing protein n=1 Tax=Streptomyces qinglanensis TaxID=943816 RepID=UPI003D765BE3